MSIARERAKAVAHRCGSKHRTFKTYARCAYGGGVDLYGDGQFGIVLHFNVAGSHRRHLHLYKSEDEWSEQYEWMRSKGADYSGTATGQFDPVILQMKS